MSKGSPVLERRKSLKVSFANKERKTDEKGKRKLETVCSVTQARWQLPCPRRKHAFSKLFGLKTQC